MSELPGRGGKKTGGLIRSNLTTSYIITKAVKVEVVVTLTNTGMVVDTEGNMTEDATGARSLSNLPIAIQAS